MTITAILTCSICGSAVPIRKIRDVRGHRVCRPCEEHATVSVTEVQAVLAADRRGAR